MQNRLVLTEEAAHEFARLRRDAGVTQYEVADLLSWPRSKVKRIECAETKTISQEDFLDLMGLLKDGTTSRSQETPVEEALEETKTALEQIAEEFESAPKEEPLSNEYVTEVLEKAQEDLELEFSGPTQRRLDLPVLEEEEDIKKDTFKELVLFDKDREEMVTVTGSLATGLARLRHSRNLSLTKVSRDTGIPKVELLELESHKKLSVSRALLKKLAHYYEASEETVVWMMTSNKDEIVGLPKDLEWPLDEKLRISSKVEDLLQDSGFSKKGLSKRLGISPYMANTLLKGQATRTSYEILARLSVLLERDVRELYVVEEPEVRRGPKGEMLKPSPWKRELEQDMGRVALERLMKKSMSLRELKEACAPYREYVETCTLKDLFELFEKKGA